MATETRDVDVVVIGAGLAGLTAAYRLLKLSPECRVLVIEAKDRVGGRTYTVDLKTANGSDKWDLGGQWVSRNQFHILWLLEELGMKTYDQYREGRSLTQLGSHVIKTQDSTMPKFPFLSIVDMGLAMNKIDKMVKQVPRDDPRKCPKADLWDSMTLETLINSITWRKDTRAVFEYLIEAVAGVRMREMSALYFLHSVSTVGSFMDSVDDENGGSQEWKVTGGVQQLSELLTERVGKDNVLLSEPVKLIDQSDEETVEVTTESGKKFTCKYVINASPINCSVAMDYKPTFPLTRQSYASRSPMGNSFKFIVTYNTAFWRENGFSGQIASKVNLGAADKNGNDSPPIAVVIDNTSSNDNPSLVGFYANAWYWRNVELSERREAVLKHLSEFLGGEAANPLEFVDKDWSAEPFNGGCSGSVVTPGAITSFYDGLKTPFDRVHWAGTETATAWMGYLSGAVQSGMRAAEEVLSRINPGFEGDPLLKELDLKESSPK